MKSEFIKNRENVKIHVVKENKSKIPIILSHGFKGNWRAMLPIAKKLPDKYYSIMYDAKAHGLSEAPDGGYSLEEMSQDIVCICQELDLKNPVLMGHSMGGTLALLASSKIPAKKVILEDPAGKISENKKYNNLEKELERFRLKDISVLEKEYEKNYPNFPNNFYRIIALARKQLRPEISKITIGGYPTVEDIISKKEIPDALLLRPDSDLVNYNIKEDLDDKIDRRIIQDSRHTIFRDCPNEFISIVKKFLD